MERDNRRRGGNRAPRGLSFIIWSALLRAPWLIGDFTGSDEHREAERRRRWDR